MIGAVSHLCFRVANLGMSDPDGNRIELHELRPDGWQLAALKRLESGE